MSRNLVLFVCNIFLRCSILVSEIENVKFEHLIKTLLTLLYIVKLLPIYLWYTGVNKDSSHCIFAFLTKDVFNQRNTI